MFIILSKFSIPSKLSNFPARVFALFNFAERCLYTISFTKDDLPDPETPVTQTNLPTGISTLIFFKVFSVAPFMVIKLPFPCLLEVGVSIPFLPDKY